MTVRIWGLTEGSTWPLAIRERSPEVGQNGAVLWAWEPRTGPNLLLVWKSWVGSFSTMHGVSSVPQGEPMQCGAALPLSRHLF